MKYITPLLETQRLMLKKGKINDFEKVYEYDFTKLRDINGEFKLETLDKEKLKGFDTYSDTHDEVFDWIVYLKESNEPIANIVANRENKKLKSTELSFNMHPKYWQHGYMKESIIRVLDFLFEYGFKNVTCGYSEGNIKSKNLINKLGFEPLSVVPNAWIKDGIYITNYNYIMSKEKFNRLYKDKFIHIS